MNEEKFSVYAVPRVVAAVVIVTLMVWGTSFVLNFLSPESDGHAAVDSHGPASVLTADAAEHGETGAAVTEHAIADAAASPAAVDTHVPVAAEKVDKKRKTVVTTTPAPYAPASEHGGTAGAGGSKPRTRGLAFVTAAVKPMEYELKERFMGWRPNDIVQPTDNINNFQLGVLEVTRRTAVMLAERLSRTGTTDILDENLERAMNWFMVKADSFMFPSAEQKYQEGIDEMRAYGRKLARGEARFFTRSDNIIPLFKTYADVLGGCDENLVKSHEKDGSRVSTFAADDYFYYAKGVASTMLVILEAVAEDFHETLETRGSADTLHHAIEACHHAANLDPLIILESDLDGIFANHRANMAAHISHARFYLDVLVNALST
ncbi:MAG: DUF2333 family protein [Thermodesulfobacteriota bacterium]|nr:DUF2333 family protein [Thermodesulfobacteriota bacterium]